MITLEKQTGRLHTPRQKIACLPLPDFDGAYFYEMQMGFSSAVPVKLGQAWMEQAETAFAPGQIRTGWRRDALLIYAELTDDDIYTRASVGNQRLWELGDTFEIFLQPATGQEYVELQITPNNLHLQLRFPDSDAAEDLRRHGLDKYLIAGEGFRSWSWTHSNAKLWSIYAEIPATTLGLSARSLDGQQWYFSFSRYDYTRGTDEPVISSTSPHAVANFHWQLEWGVLQFTRESLRPLK